MRLLGAAIIFTLAGIAPGMASESGSFGGVTLSPGETIIQSFGAQPAPIIRIPKQQRQRQAQKQQRARRAPPLEIDRVTRKHRNRAGWTGRASRPAGVACFPAGTCQSLNRN